jgi:hypothetical protein
MGSYVGSDYLAKLLLPKSQILNTETIDEIKVKSNLGVAKEELVEKDYPDKIGNKIKDDIEKIPYIGLTESWGEMDFIKDYITPHEEEETKEKILSKGREKKEGFKKDEEKEEQEIPVYSYLDPENMDLEYEFSLCSNRNAIYTVHICGFSIDTDGDQPFLKYLFEQFGETFGFPHFDFACPSNVGDPASFISWIWQTKKTEDTESDEPPGHVYFLNECLKRIMGIINVNDHSDPNALKPMYKGFLQDKTDPLKIYAFFDFGDMALEKTEFRRVWAIMDEIINHKKILGFGIDPKIWPLFDDDTGLSMILDKEGYKVQLPYVMYLCEMEDGKYVNVYNEDDADTVYEERTMHPIFGRFYLFSVNPFDFQSEKSIFKIERYAVFANDPIYFLKDIKDPLFLDPDFDDNMKGEHNESIYFKGPDGVPLWCIKSSDDFTRL